MIFGNDEAKRVVSDFTENSDTTLFAFGPRFVGKRTYITNLVQSKSEIDTLVVDTGIEDAREVREFLFVTPTELNHRIVVINNFESMQLVSQDAYLKILEEPPPHSKIIVISDLGMNINEMIRSRIRKSSYWTVLSDGSFSQYLETVTDVPYSGYCGNLPGVVEILRKSSNFFSFFSLLQLYVDDGINLIEKKVPEIFSKKEENSDLKRCLSIFIRNFTYSNLQINDKKYGLLLSLSSDLESLSSINLEMIWMKFLLSQ